jgi:hypothetical protein
MACKTFRCWFCKYLLAYVVVCADMTHHNPRENPKPLIKFFSHPHKNGNDVVDIVTQKILLLGVITISLLPNVDFGVGQLGQASGRGINLSFSWADH